MGQFSRNHIDHLGQFEKHTVQIKLLNPTHPFLI